MSAISIRMLGAWDIPQIIELYGEQDVYLNTLQLPYPSVEQWNGLLGRPGHTSLVAVNGEEVLGHTGIDMQPRPRRRHVASFGVAVKGTARGKGVGSALVGAAVEVCEGWSTISRIELQVYTDNHAAIAAYRRHGFEIEGTGRQYAIRDGAFVDAHFMVRLRPGGVIAAPVADTVPP